VIGVKRMKTLKMRKRNQQKKRIIQNLIWTQKAAGPENPGTV
jgi:hypothetical protein